MVENGQHHHRGAFDAKRHEISEVLQHVQFQENIMDSSSEYAKKDLEILAQIQIDYDLL